jgi:hypothetical protein
MRSLILLLAAASLAAQEPVREVRHRDPAAFAIEAAAGSAGSLIGIAAVGLSHKCGVEDLACLIMKAGASGATGALGATLGSYAAAGYTGNPRSLGGAALGAVLGTGVGLGVHWLLNRASDRNFDDPYAVVPIFTLSQGIVSALGSRVLSRGR